MNDELRAAAERLRIPGLRAVAFHCGQGCVDIGILADAYLAEHPADDGEAVTVEWLESVGFTRGQAPDAIYIIHLREVGDLSFSSVAYDPFYNRWYANGRGCKARKTRGDVRRLCAALGIELAEKVEG